MNPIACQFSQMDIILGKLIMRELKCFSPETYIHSDFKSLKSMISILMTFLYKSLYLQIRLQKPQKEPMAKEC